MLIGFVNATTLQIHDARGVDARLMFLKCPRRRCPGLLIKLNDLEPAHLGFFAVRMLCEGLRAGADWAPLRPAVGVPELLCVIMQKPGGAEHFMLAYEKHEPLIAYFLVNGQAPTDDTLKFAVALDPDFRRKLADMLTAELVAHDAQEARA